MRHQEHLHHEIVVGFHPTQSNQNLAIECRQMNGYVASRNVQQHRLFHLLHSQDVVYVRIEANRLERYRWSHRTTWMVDASGVYLLQVAGGLRYRT